MENKRQWPWTGVILTALVLGSSAAAEGRIDAETHPPTITEETAEIPASVDIRSQNMTPPIYPIKAIDSGWEGVVVLVLSVDQDGRLTAARVDHSSGHADLDQAALDAVQHWQFQPAILNGQPHPGLVRVPIRFSLN